MTGFRNTWIAVILSLLLLLASAFLLQQSKVLSSLHLTRVKLGRTLVESHQEAPSQILSCSASNSVEVTDLNSFSTQTNSPLLLQNDPRILTKPTSSNPDEQHHLCVIIPYRNRWVQLLVLNHLLGRFLRNQGIQYRMFAINQSDSYRFNQGSLMNVGVQVAIKYGCDYIALHDVDLIPVHRTLSYQYPKEGVYHVSPNDLWLQYQTLREFLGGIAIMTVSSYLQIDGFANLYWGWGREDDEFLRRVRMHLSENFTMQRPPRRNESGSENDEYFTHLHGNESPRDKRTMWLLPDLEDVKVNGYKHVQFKCKRMYVMDEPDMVDKDLIIVDVELMCNTTLSPYCDEAYVEAVLKKKEMEEKEAKKAELNK
mmetsp:Transcript_774/g.1414  ORF Transcript_774/g.1414 Transcript_774/m.1414 type:complete len:369 (-) Transcript_774:778-1884(-)